MSEVAQKPVVKIRDWVLTRGRLFGTALNHPKAPGGGESDVATSRVLNYDEATRRVETLNTIYELVGEGNIVN